MARKRTGEQTRQPTFTAQRTPRASTPAPAAKREARQRREAPARRIRWRRRLRRGAVIGALVIGALAAVGWPIYQNLRADAELEAALTAGSYTHDEKSDPGRDHVTSPSYEVNPPAGGAHLASPADAGSYSGQSVPADGALVHSLGHGMVILWHRPDLDAAERKALEALAAKFPDDVIVVERESMPSRVAATAWHQRILGEKVERGPLLRFITEFRDKGPENVG
ncbi:MAG: DUF3105 domain-containing protein [Micromonosporaceae bacterium]